jgi:hypothetical protein
MQTLEIDQLSTVASPEESELYQPKPLTKPFALALRKLGDETKAVRAERCGCAKQKCPEGCVLDDPAIIYRYCSLKNCEKCAPFLVGAQMKRWDQALKQLIRERARFDYVELEIEQPERRWKDGESDPLREIQKKLSKHVKRYFISTPGWQRKRLIVRILALVESGNPTVNWQQILPNCQISPNLQSYSLSGSFSRLLTPLPIETAKDRAEQEHLLGNAHTLRAIGISQKPKPDNKIGGEEKEETDFLVLDKSSKTKKSNSPRHFCPHCGSKLILESVNEPSATYCYEPHSRLRGQPSPKRAIA